MTWPEAVCNVAGMLTFIVCFWVFSRMFRD